MKIEMDKNIEFDSMVLNLEKNVDKLESKPLTFDYGEPIGHIKSAQVKEDHIEVDAELTEEGKKKVEQLEEFKWSPAVIFGGSEKQITEVSGQVSGFDE